METSRYVVSLKLLGKEQNEKTPKVEVFAIEVELSDESVYTIFRCKKEIALFHHKVMNMFPAEAGQFKESERVIPECPLKKTVFGIKQANNDENQLGRLLYNYFKKFSRLPSNIIRSDTVMEFATLAPSDMEINDEKKKKKRARIPRRNESLRMTTTNKISKPILCKSYIAIADFNGKRLRFKKDTFLQVLQKDPRGWWLVDIHGELGWAPASYLVLRDGDDIEEEEEENEALIQQDRVGARYISTLSYKESRDDEISFSTGAIVRVIKKYIDGWWLVKYNGREGFVPGSYFKRFDRRQATAYVKNIKRKYTQRKTTCVRRCVNTEDSNNEKKPDQPENVESDTKDKTIAVYECIAKFIGREGRHELSLNRGDIVKVLEMKDNGWWYVQDWHGLSGWVSSSFLKDIHDGLNTSESIKKKIGTQCEVVSAFDGQSENELTIKKGDIVSIVLVSDDGWWRVRLTNDDGTEEEGLVPSVCLSDKRVKKTQHTNNNDHTSNSSANSTGMIVSVSDEAESVSVNPVRDTDDVFDDSSYWTGSDNSDDFKDCYIVAADYMKQSVDEVDAMEGEIACVIDHTQKDYWYVEIDNREGWMPSNILRRITDKELNNSSRSSPETTPETTPLPDTVPTPQETANEHKPREITMSQSSEESHRLCVVSISSDEDSSDDNSNEMEDIQKALAEAERVAREANEKAATLRKLAEDKILSGKGGSNGTKITRELLVERLV